MLLPVDIFSYVVFGGTGDLAFRKIYPSLYHRFVDMQVLEGSKIICLGRGALQRSDFLEQLEVKIKMYVGKDFDPHMFRSFCQMIDYQALQADKIEDFQALALRLQQSPALRIYYFSTPPSIYENLCRNLAACGLNVKPSRVVLEKPIGHDLASSRAINEAVGLYFSEEQIYRIDHYLGKETVQNLLALRFGNALFERLWHGDLIDHVQISVCEKVGLEGRASYYNSYGALRDMVQNHLLQLLCLVAMEPPRLMEADAIRDEKLKVLKSLRPLDPKDLALGQYGAGLVEGLVVPAYVQELEKESLTETYAAMKVYVDNWRWSGVPFYLRTGKRLFDRSSEIVIQFKPVRYSIFPDSVGSLIPNRLVLRLQPNEGMSLQLMTKIPGSGGFRLRSVPLDLTYAEEFDQKSPDAYERLLLDVVRGNSTLFMRRDEVDAAWAWMDPVIHWPRPQIELYAAGSAGPLCGQELMTRDGRQWLEDLALNVGS